MDQGFPILVGIQAAPAHNVAVEVTHYNCGFPSRCRFTHVCVKVLIEVICWFPFTWRICFNDEGIVVNHSRDSTVDTRIRMCQIATLDVAGRVFD